MKRQPERAEEEEEEADDAVASALPLPDMPRTGYRVSGDLEVHSAELRQELGEQKATIQRLEREVWAARKAVKNRRRLSALANGGLGSLVGTLLGYAATVAFGNPIFALACTVVGFLVGLRWKLPDDDDFPDAPPPRMF